MEALNDVTVSSRSSKAGRGSRGTCSATFLSKLAVEHLDRRPPKDSTLSLAWLTSRVRALTNAWRERIKARRAREASPRRRSGARSLGSVRAVLNRNEARRPRGLCAACLSILLLEGSTLTVSAVRTTSKGTCDQP